jgi:cytosine/adenosine deaminase-related metal-dependent hydrolase
LFYKIEKIRADENCALARVKVLTPRFVPTCTPALMRGLSKIAKEHDALIQSHISENRNEIAWVRDLHKDCSSYAAVYDTHGLLTPSKQKYGEKISVL